MQFKNILFLAALAVAQGYNGTTNGTHTNVTTPIVPPEQGAANILKNPLGVAGIVGVAFAAAL